MLGAESAGLETLDDCEHLVSFLLYFMSSAPWTASVYWEYSINDPSLISEWLQEP